MLIEPGGQISHLLDPGPLYSPGLHVIQTDAPDALNVPASQLAQTPEPVDLANVPGAHAAQDDAPLEPANMPTGQLVQLEEAVKLL